MRRSAGRPIPGSYWTVARRLDGACTALHDLDCWSVQRARDCRRRLGRTVKERALASQPEIIFADEPTGNLDSRASTDLLDFLRHAVTELGQTIIMVTHDPLAAAHADRVVSLADGRVVSEMQAPTADSVLDVMRHLGD